MASVANHTCLTTNGGTNGTVVVDLSSGHKPTNGALRGNNNYNHNRERNKTIPLLHVHAHHHHHSHHNNHNNHHHHHHHNHHNNHLLNNCNGSGGTNNGATTTTVPVGVVSPSIAITAPSSAPIATSMINNSNGRAHVGRRVSSPVGPT